MDSTISPPRYSEIAKLLLRLHRPVCVGPSRKPRRLVTRPLRSNRSTRKTWRKSLTNLLQTDKRLHTTNGRTTTFSLPSSGALLHCTQKRHFVTRRGVTLRVTKLKTFPTLILTMYSYFPGANLFLVRHC